MSIFSGNITQMLYSVLVRALIAFTVLPLHEWAHGYAAYKLGDNTARAMGRLTVNPLKHFDPIGTTAMILTGIGWARPVPINPNNFKNRKAGMAISALAGPLMNFFISFSGMIIYKILFYVFVKSGIYRTQIATTVLDIIILVIMLNVSLAVFNLLPIPPLDGSRLASYFLPEKTYFKIMKYEQIIMIVLIAVLFMGWLDTPLLYIRQGAVWLLDKMTYPVDIILDLLL